MRLTFSRRKSAAALEPLAPLPEPDERNLARLLAAYALRMHRGFEGHGVCSPLGVWLLLALCAPASSGETRRQLEEALGCSAETAGAHARTLLNSPHPGVGTALALWTNLAVPGPKFDDWVNTLPSAVEDGPIPSQAVADDWTRRSTYDLIRAFPVELTPDMGLVFASALATKITWNEAFQLTASSALGRSPWVARVQQVLLAQPTHTRAILRTHAGDIGIHAARSADEDLLVLCAIADPQVPSQVVLAVAHDAVEWVLAPYATPHIARRSLFDVPLGESTWSVITERPTTDGQHTESTDAVLPAWSVQTRIEVGELADGGAPAALAALEELLAQPFPMVSGAVQVAKAAYSRTGFEAAAVSALAMRPTGPPPQNAPGAHRDALLRFGHPYAVVAVALDGSGAPPGPWHGVPVFSAWVAEPEEPND